MVDHRVLKELIKLHWKIKRPLFTHGPVGIGKSDVHRQAGMEIADELSLDFIEYTDDPSRINDEDVFMFIDTRLAQLDPSDLRGIPWVFALVKDNGKYREVPVNNLSEEMSLITMRTKWCPPIDFPQRGYGLWLFDELNIAPEIVQKSAYQLFLRRCLGTYKVPDGFGLFVAGNREEDGCGVIPQPKALENRFNHVELDPPSIEDWSNWAVINRIDSNIVGFLNFKPTMLFSWDPNAKSYAQPTPRTWEFASQIIQEIGHDNLKEIQVAVSTAVGEGASLELVSFMRKKENLPDIKEILKNPKKLDLENMPVDIKYVLVTSLAEHGISHKDDAEEIKRITKTYGYLINQGLVEMSFLGLKLMYPHLTDNVRNEVIYDSSFDELLTLFKYLT